MPFAKSPLLSLKIQAELSVIKKKNLSVAASCLFHLNVWVKEKILD